MQIGIIGTGSWATALVHLLQPSVERIYWFWPNPRDIDYIHQHGRNPRYLKDTILDMKNLFLTNNPERLLEASELVLYMVPSAFLKTILDRYFSSCFTLLKERVAISGIKGFEIQSGLTILNFLHKHIDISVSGCIGGPAHAEEIVSGQRTVLTLASNHHNNESIQRFYYHLKRDYIKVIRSEDPEGLEYAAILKNVYAILIGYLRGVGIGDNYVSAVVCSCLAEMETILQHFHPHPFRQIIHSAYLGDFLVTAYSLHSRNRRLGELRGKGFTLKEAQEKLQMVAEGLYATSILVQKYALNYPLLRLVNQILFRQITTEEVLSSIPLL